MIPFLPKQIATKAIYLYLGALTVVSLLFFSHAMSLTYIIMGIAWVVGFFLLSSHCSQKWLEIPQKRLITYLFLTALGLRVAWVFFSYAASANTCRITSAFVCTSFLAPTSTSIYCDKP